MVVKVFISGISGNKEVSSARPQTEALRYSGWLSLPSRQKPTAAPKCSHLSRVLQKAHAQNRICLVFENSGTIGKQARCFVFLFVGSRPYLPRSAGLKHHPRCIERLCFDAFVNCKSPHLSFAFDLDLANQLREIRMPAVAIRLAR